MEIELLQEVIEAWELELPVSALWLEFEKAQPGQDMLAFIQSLEERELIPEGLARELRTHLAVELTTIDLLRPYYDHTQIVDRRTETSPHAGFSFSPQEMAQHFQLIEQIGAGAMGSIHLAKDRFLRRKVAFKKLLPEYLTPETAQRFIGEVQITAQLDHPHIVPIYSLEQADAEPAYSMKIIKGVSLKEWIAEIRKAAKEGKLSAEHNLQARLSCFLKICAALSLAHQKGVIHRDLKPANIMLGDHHEVYVMDWGIARPIGTDLSQQEIDLENLDYLASEAQQIVGTPRYMSPEQAAGKNDALDQRSDLFALGLILFELVTLKQAVQGKNMTEVLRKVIRRELVPLSSAYGEKISPALAAIIEKATARRRKDRYATVADMAADLRRFLRDEPVTAHDESVWFRLLRLTHRYRQWLLGAMVVLLLGGGGLTAGIGVWQQIALQRAEQRRLQLSELLADLANQGQLMNGRLLQMENLLQAFAGAAQVALLHGQPAEVLQAPGQPQQQPHPMGPAFRQGLFQIGNAAPRLPEPLPEGPVFAYAHWWQPLPSSEIDPTRLWPLQPALWQVLLESQDPALLAQPRDQQLKALQSQQSPIQAVALQFPGQGHLLYPAQLPVHSPQPAWLQQAPPQAISWEKSPVQRQQLLLSLSSPLPPPFEKHSAQLQIDLRKLLGHLEGLEGWPAPQQVMLLNPKAEPVYIHEQKPFSLQAADQAALQELFAKQQTGYLNLGQTQILGYTHLRGPELWWAVVYDWSVLQQHTKP